MSRRHILASKALTWGMALTICALIAHFGTNALVSYATYRLGMADPVLPSAFPGRQPAANAADDGSGPRDSLFHSRKDAAQPRESGPISAEGLPLAPATVGIALAGTMIRPDGFDNMAVIFDKKTGKQNIFHEGDLVGKILIKRILRHKVVIEENGSAAVLVMPFKGGERAPRPPRQPAPPQNAPKNPG
ncbi:hypothetical protein ASZ90_000058 [hydrocarbon metagenome]|uniref:Type II secretion system protein GspC N-terminal domain-containing protein n=1 Tax=hydrocarbon metagenome TaxID=938273 RepID=A0A0W8GAG6_9ZZZZ